jgi:hypothetical protein
MPFVGPARPVGNAVYLEHAGETVAVFAMQSPESAVFVAGQVNYVALLAVAAQRERDARIAESRLTLGEIETDYDNGAWAAGKDIAAQIRADPVAA